MIRRRRRLSGRAVLALALAACGGGDKRAESGAAAKKIKVTPSGDARADAKTYLAQLCPKPMTVHCSMRPLPA